MRHLSETFHLDPLRASREKARLTSHLDRLPQILEVVATIHIRHNPNLTSYINSRMSLGDSMAQIAATLNNVYSTDLFTRNVIASVRNRSQRKKHEVNRNAAWLATRGA